MQSLDGHLVLSPSDLNDYVECSHLTTLELEVARGQRARSFVAEEEAELLRRRGLSMSVRTSSACGGRGARLSRSRSGNPGTSRPPLDEPGRPCVAGVDVISQATFMDGRWRGRADFLLRVERTTRLGTWGYEPLDAKLARAEKPTYVLQLCFYSDGIATIQGAPPEHMHVLLGIGEQRKLRYYDFAAYYRRVRRGFETALVAPAATEPYPVEHCSLCTFREVCAARWEAEDHLVQVANLRRARLAARQALEHARQHSERSIEAQTLRLLAEVAEASEPLDIAEVLAQYGGSRKL